VKWRSKKATNPPPNSYRRRRCFAWKPREIGDVVVWLETYQVEEVYRVPLNGSGYWRVLKEEPLYPAFG
jgi:hypothetical protein